MCRVAGLLSIIYISRHKSNALARELGQVIPLSSGIAIEGDGPGSAYLPDWDSRREPLSAAQMDSNLEVVGIPDSMRAHQVHAPVIRPLFGSPQNRSMVGVAGRPVQQVGKELVHILGGAEIGGRLNGRKTPKSH